MTNGTQFTAARAWFGMSQKELCDALGITRPTLVALEKDPTSVSRNMSEKVHDYYKRRGLDISDGGLKVLNEPIVKISGEGWYLKLLDDVQWSGAKELLIEFSDDRVSPPPVIEKYRELRASGVQMRQLIESGNEYLHGPIDEYRCVPKSHFKNWVTLVYGDKIAFSVDDRHGCTIVTDKNAAEVERLKFELLWSLLKKPERSVADVRF